MFDRAVRPIAILAALEALGIFAALAAVGFAADAVHRDGEALMGLGAQCAERHAGGGETLADVFDRLDFVDRHRTVGHGEHLKEVAERDGRICEHGLDIFFVILRLAGLVGALDADIRVETLEHRGRDRMHLAAAAEPVVAGVAEFAGFDRWLNAIGHAVTREAFARDLAVADAFNLRGRAAETFADEFR